MSGLRHEAKPDRLEEGLKWKIFPGYMNSIPSTCVGPNRLPFNKIQTDTNRFKTGVLRPSPLTLADASQVLVWPVGQVSLALHMRPKKETL